MSDGVEQLSEKEKEALRLLLVGHDAKSTAQQLGVSVHTINDRLRHARRKLEAPSSRAAARILGAAEASAPQNVAHNDIGMAADAEVQESSQQSQPGHSRMPSAVWLAGGMLLMSMLIATTLFLFMGSGPANKGNSVALQEERDLSAQAEQSAALADARSWVSIVDREAWDESWKAASELFQSQIGSAQWAATVRPVREPLGAVLARDFRSATQAESLPGAPDGEYEIIEFSTSFANIDDTVETVVMVRQSDGWKVAGYFVRPD